MPKDKAKEKARAIALIRAGALDQEPVVGLTHRFYRYPARFSPVFARACIDALSNPGDVVLDPYMGGATTIIEAMVAGRQPVGSDLNSLAVFIARTKTTLLSDREERAILNWATGTVPSLRCTDFVNDIAAHSLRNMSWPYTRWLKKTIALCLAAANDELQSGNARQFARCALLNAGQWALNGRKQLPSASEFRSRVVKVTKEMLAGIQDLRMAIEPKNRKVYAPLLRENDAESIHSDKAISKRPVDLVVTSPPYPGIHMLYHRWQVDGRKETNAPYWIAACNDGQGASYYNFADRRRDAEDRYFEKAESSFASIRQLMRQGALLAQMVAFCDPDRQLRRYLGAMERAGFAEYRHETQRRIWRAVPGRNWHASYKGELSSSREVVLLHVAV